MQTLAPAAATDPYDSYLSSLGGETTQPAQQQNSDAGYEAYLAKLSAQQPETQTTSQPFNMEMLPSQNPVQDWAGGFGEATLMPAVGTVAGGFRGLWDLAMGKGAQQASQDIQQTENALTVQPMNAAQKAGQEAAQSDWNPLNWPAEALGWAGKKLGNTAERMGAPPGVSTLLRVMPTAAGSALSLKAGLGGEAGETEEAAGAAKTASEAKTGESATGQVSQAKTAADATQAERRAILERVGIKNARESALTGDAKSAAAEYQLTRFDHPAGKIATEQFSHEVNALSNHAAGIVESTGGTLGMDEDALANKGAIIDKPFADVKNYLNNQIRQMYAAADARAQGIPAKLDSFQQVLNDDSLMTNQDRMALRNGIRSYAKQLNMITDSPNGLSIQGTAANAETLRKYLNAEWTPQNSRFVGQLKNALDDDVSRAAGGQIYQQARAIRSLKGQILEDPNGVSQLFDTDPNTPINRSTPLERIPGKLTNLSADQFENVLTILKQMPDEVQPQAQAALGQIRGYLANKLLQAGSQTGRGRELASWNGDAVSNVLKTNAAKYRLAFQDDPEALSKIDDLNKAGQILKVDTSYPGAYAQAANSMKRGIIARTIAGGSRIAGAAGGGFFGPFGAAAGEVAGGALGETTAARTAEKAAVNMWKKKIIPIGGG